MSIEKANRWSGSLPTKKSPLGIEEGRFGDFSTNLTPIFSHEELDSGGWTLGNWEERQKEVKWEKKVGRSGEICNYIVGDSQEVAHRGEKYDFDLRSILPSVYRVEPTPEIPYASLHIEFGVKEYREQRGRAVEQMGMIEGRGTDFGVREYIITPFTPLTFNMLREINNLFKKVNIEAKKIIESGYITKWHDARRSSGGIFGTKEDSINLGKRIIKKLERLVNYSPRVILYGRGSMTDVQYAKLNEERGLDLKKVLEPLLELYNKQGIGDKEEVLSRRNWTDKELVPINKKLINTLKEVEKKEQKEEVKKDPPDQELKTEFTKWKSGFCSLFGKIKDQSYDDLFSMWLFLYPNISVRQVLIQPSTDKELDDLNYERLTGGR